MVRSDNGQVTVRVLLSDKLFGTNVTTDWRVFGPLSRTIYARKHALAHPTTQERIRQSAQATEAVEANKLVQAKG